MNIITVIVYSYILVAGILIFLLYRDRKYPTTFLGRHRTISGSLMGILIFGILLGIYSHNIEPYILRIKNQNIPFHLIKKPVRIALVADMQVGDDKQSDWMEKIVAKAEKVNPDIMLIAGDLVNNQGNSNDESVYLEPLKKLVGKFPIYYVLGNHDYGVSWQNGVPNNYDKHELVMNRMKKIGIPLLKNELTCPTLNEQKICFFGTDDIWGSSADYGKLSEWDKQAPMVLVSHNPDAILSWPQEAKKPDLILAGHTHGGQVYLPFVGPLGSAQVALGKRYYRWLNYWNGIPIFVTVGSGESLGTIRLFTPPEIAVILLTP